jgi:tetratricopeptide (TPR) repeat protein
VLYTQEFYRQVREHLTDDGVFVEWVPIHFLRLAEFKIIVRTFQSVFPHSSLWVTYGADERGGFGSYTLLAGTMEPLKIDVSRMRERLGVEAVRRDLEPYGLHTPAGFLDTFFCAEDALRRWAGEGPVNTDNLPFTQYETSYSRGRYLDGTDLLEPMEDIWPYLVNTGSEQEAKQLREEFALRTKATRLALQGRLMEAFSVLPDDVRYKQMGRLYANGPRYNQSLAEIYRDNPKTLEFLAMRTLRGPGGLQEAAPIYFKLLQADPKNLQALNTLGAAFIKAGLLKEAEDYLRRAVVVAPDCVEAQFNLGLVLERTGRSQEALACMRRVLELNPQNKTARDMVIKMEGRGPRR